MVFATSILQTISSESIHIFLEGQNITQIKEYQRFENAFYGNDSYQDYQWNPCLPIPANDPDNKLTITFGLSSQSNWRNWYPLNICDYENNKEDYDNNYLFEAFLITLNNLTMDTYVITENTNYGIIGASGRGFEVSIAEIKYALINNVISNTNATDGLSEYVLFNADEKFKVIHSSFINISVTNSVFQGYARNWTFENNYFDSISAGVVIYSLVKLYLLL